MTTETQTPATEATAAPKRSHKRKPAQTPPTPQVTTMSVDGITLAPQIQNIRDRLDKETVERYAAISSSLNRAPLEVFDITSGDLQGYKVLSAGHHRLAGAQLAGLTEVPVVLLQGTLVEAYEHAVRTNRDHGIRFTSLERRRLAEQFIGQEKENDFIMDILLYSRTGVQTIRNEVKSRSEHAQLPNLSNKHYRFLKDAPSSDQLAAAANAHHWPVAVLKEAIKVLKNGKSTDTTKAAVLNQTESYYVDVEGTGWVARNAAPVVGEVRDEAYHAQLAAAAAPAAPLHVVTVSPAPVEEGPTAADLNDPELAALVAETEAEVVEEAAPELPVPGARITYATSTCGYAIRNATANLRRAMEEVFDGTTLQSFNDGDFRGLLTDLTTLDALMLEFGERVTNARQGTPSHDLPF